MLSLDRKLKGKCMDWIGSLGLHGYGIYSDKLVHRIIYKAFYGEIGKDLVVDHMCRNRKCCNPFHLRLVTREVNCMENSNAPFALNALKTHCPKGHEYTKDNIYEHKRVGRKNHRECKKCTLERFKRQRDANK